MCYVDPRVILSYKYIGLQVSHRPVCVCVCHVVSS